MIKIKRIKTSVQFLIFSTIIIFLFSLSCQKNEITDDTGNNNDTIPNDTLPDDTLTGDTILYEKKDTIFHISFNNSIEDISNYKHALSIKGDIELLKDREGNGESAGFFDGISNYLGFELSWHDSLEIDFWLAPFKVVKNAIFLDYINSFFSVWISDTDTTYVDASTAATYTISSGYDDQHAVTRSFEVKPYRPDSLEAWDDNSTWQHVQIMIGKNVKPAVYINSALVGELDTNIFNFPVNKATITIGGDAGGNNLFHGKIDDFIIKNFHSSDRLAKE